MKPEYKKWIDANYPDSISAKMKCHDATKCMERDFPELRKMRGYALVDGYYRPHWWCINERDEIIDPTCRQWFSAVADYIPVSNVAPKCRCMGCGEWVVDSVYSNHCDPCGDAAFKKEATS